MTSGGSTRSAGAKLTARAALATPTAVQPAAPIRTLQRATDVLYLNEVRRGRVWVRLCVVFAVSGLVGAAVITAEPTSRALLAADCAVFLVAAAFAWWVLRDERRYSRRLAALFSCVCATCMVPAYYFGGWFSAITLLVPLGGVTLALGQERGTVIAIGGYTCLTHAAVAVATIFGVIEDHGLIALRTSAHAEQLLLLVFVQGVIASSFVVGWELRQQSLDAVVRYGLAVRDAARREALLQEALFDLEAVRKAGPGGRFSGTALGGFRLAEVIGRGAMGEVYEAVRIEGGERAAVKVMTVDRADNRRAVERFDREIRLAAALETPHVARVLDHSAPGDAVQYLAMERLVGTSLAELVRRRAMAVTEVLECLDQVASAVDLAHRAGIVHRDLKPSNLFRHEVAGRRALWKVLDFGVSKMNQIDSSLTGGGMVGTPGYMAPEQATGEEVGPAADLFSLGAIAFRVLVGRPAFVGPDVLAILDAVSDTMPPRPAALAPLPVDVDLVLAIALAKQPDHRFASARELADALAAACRAELPDELRRRGEALSLLFPWRTDPE